MFTKELLNWYLITVKLREAVESGAATTSTTSPTIEFPEQILHSLQKQQQEPSESLQIVIRNYGENCEEVDNPPDSEWVISIKEKLEQASQDDAASSWAKMTVAFIALMFSDEVSCEEGLNRNLGIGSRDGHIIVLQIIKVTKATVNTLCYRTQRGWNQVQEKEDRSLLGQKIQEWNSPYSSALDP